MTKKLIKFIGLLVLAAILAVSSLASAADGMVNSVAFDPVPRGARLTVETYDDSEHTVILERDFTDAIRRAGYVTEDNAPLAFTFEIRNVIGAWSTGDRRHIFSFETQRGSDGGGDRTEARVNVFNSTSGGLLNKGQSETSIATPSSYRIDVTVEDKKAGRTLWQGWTVADLTGADHIELTRRMVPVLVEAIGKTLRQETFPLY